MQSRQTSYERLLSGVKLPDNPSPRLKALLAMLERNPHEMRVPQLVELVRLLSGENETTSPDKPPDALFPKYARYADWIDPIGLGRHLSQEERSREAGVLLAYYLNEEC